jgi:hypothetical protein
LKYHVSKGFDELGADRESRRKTHDPTERARTIRTSLVRVQAANSSTRVNGFTFSVSVQASNKSAANSPVKPSAPEGPAAVPDEPARGRKPVLRDESAAVVAKQQYPRERFYLFFSTESSEYPVDPFKNPLGINPKKARI